MTHDELLATIDAMDAFARTKTHGFSTYVSPKDGEKPFITTLDWYLQTGNHSHAKDKVANTLGMQLEVTKKVLRAVVGLHKPSEPISDDGFITCETCNYEYFREYPYPCETIQAVERELR